MYERLTERTENGGVKFSNGEYWNTVYPQNESCLTDIHRMAIRLCEIEDKIEQGKILELPCAVGQTIYALWNCGKYGKSVAEFEVKHIDIDYLPNIEFAYISKTSFSGTYHFAKISDFGRTVFLDRASAEAKMREMKGADK